MLPDIDTQLSDGATIDCGGSCSDFSMALDDITADPQKELGLFLKQAAIASDRLPTQIRERLFEFQQGKDTSGVLLLKNCPQDIDIDDIPTPQGDSTKNSFVSEACLAITAAQLGHIFGYAQIENGALFQDIVPVPGREQEQSYASSRVELQFHTEQHFHSCMPDYLLLYCIRGAIGAETFFASLRDIISELDHHHRELLFEPLYRSGVDYIFGDSATEPGNGPVMSILYGDHDDPFLRYDEDLMVAMTPDAQSAMDALRSGLKKVMKSVCLKPGDLLMIDNRRAVHGRSPFNPAFDGKDRWLQRSKVKSDIEGITGREEIRLYK